MRVGMGMREPEDLSSAATDPPYRTPRHEPPEQQRPGAQPDEVQDEELHVAGDKRRRHAWRYLQASRGNEVAAEHTSWHGRTLPRTAFFA